MSDQILPPTTAGINPGEYTGGDRLLRRRGFVVVILGLVVVAGFSLRVWNLGTESLGEDELNKLQTVMEYRENGLSGKNGEHPFLMKGLQSVSVYAGETWNQIQPNRPITTEAALRFPTVVFGSLIAVLLYLLVSELFGSFPGLATAVLYALDPNAIGFDRIAKEDTFLLFFFLLANIFWLRGQSAAERGDPSPFRYYWLTAASFGAMMASKYMPHLLAISAAYYNLFQSIPAAKWRLGKIRWLLFFVVMGIVFVLLNPTIIIPETWREMLIFVSEKRVGHDAYEFMGQLYPNQMTKWFSGVPWTFYYVFIAFKTPLITLALFVIGLPLFFRSKMGDGRYFVLSWALFWFLPFTVLGGKFTRYYTIGQPVILIIAAVGLCFVANRLAVRSKTDFLRWSVPAAVFAILFFVSAAANPHYRLFTNTFGGGDAESGSYFPHDEFYDLSSKDAAQQIAGIAPKGAKAASETPGLLKYYLEKAGRGDIETVSLSDKKEVSLLKSGDIILVAKGRRYFSNDAIINYLNKTEYSRMTSVKGIETARIYQIDEHEAGAIRKRFGE